MDVPDGQTDAEENGQKVATRPGGPLCSELQWEVPMSVTLPIEILSAETTFPFLDTTLADLGIAPSEVKERVVLADTRRTQVKTNVGKLKEKEVMVLEVRVKAQQSDDPLAREIVYCTETHSDRSFGRSSLDILPWKHTQLDADHTQPDADHTGTVQDPEELRPVEMTFVVDTESLPVKTEEMQEA